jgi:hypothetical protein
VNASVSDFGKGPRGTALALGSNKECRPYGVLGVLQTLPDNSMSVCQSKIHLI